MTIYNSTEKEKKLEKEIMTDLQNQLYAKQRILQQSQKQLEGISSQGPTVIFDIVIFNNIDLYSE